MKKKKWIASVLVLLMLITGVCGCGVFEEEESSGTATVQGQTNRSLTSLHMSVDGSTGEMQITRPEIQEIPLTQNGDWTILVYMCGSDLESGDAAGTLDFEEMCFADASDKVRFVVQTGGAEAWQNDFANAGKIGRFIVENNDVTMVDELDGASMGDSKTLASFLKWGVQNYPAQHMGLVFWNHGSGSINGVCFDELYDQDSLSLLDIDSALYSTLDVMTDRFEMIGFDACLMGTVETANVLASYSRYMVGSQESEPGKGWDYTKIGSFLAGNPNANGAELGKVICDSFYDSCVAEDEEEIATLSVIDLNMMDEVLKSFNLFAREMYTVSENTTTLSSMIREIENADNFGGNNRSEGYTNMVDLGGLMQACSKYAGADNALNALKQAVVYNKTGSQHTGCSGLSVYYPLAVEGSSELKIFENICISPFYASFVDRQDFSSAIYYSGDPQEYSDTYYDEENGIYYFVEDGVEYCYEESTDSYWYYDEDDDEWYELENGSEYNYSDYNYDDSNDDFGYDDSYWFDDNGNWESGMQYNWDENSQSYEAEVEDNDHWNYADNYEQTGESRYITFLKKPGLDKDGVFGFTLDAKGISRASSVCGNVYQYYGDDDSTLLFLGETNDVYGDWETGHFEDGFDGYWLSLPDGQNLSLTIVDYDEDYVIYSSPILLNGNETNLRMKQNLSDQTVTVEGTWDGISDSGASAKSIRKIQSGDTIVPLYDALSTESEEETVYEGAEYKVSGTFTVDYALLEASDYLYAFVIDDIYGDYYMSDFTAFGVDENGDVWYYEE